MVSVVCQNALNEAVKDKKITHPAAILDAVNGIVEESFSSSNYLVRDGMDIALCALHYSSDSHAVLQYAGANNPLWIIRNNGDEVEEIKATKQPIGSYEQTSGFIQHEIHVEKGDKLFIFSDGYADQFGGERNKKLNRTRFKEILQVAAKLEPEEQEGYLNYVHQNWKQKEEQTDDILVIGITV
jgi:serine phosphatase RsbU (regulator of sigma subunit)